jgi:nucleoside-diphosphate-sugar epimerase
MPRKALIVGGSGQIGRAVAARLQSAGWAVTAAQRGPSDALPGIETVVLDRAENGAVARAVAAGVDALIDTVAYDEGHARQLLEVQEDVGAFVVISSASVYRDEHGRTIDEAAKNGFPTYPVPIPETHATVDPGPETYSTRKIALEQALLQGARRPVTVLRPCAIHGPGSRALREWFFVRRILDGRRAVPLAWNGESRFHTAAAVNIAALVELVLGLSGARVLNIADPEAPTVTEIGETIAHLYDHDWRLVPFDGPPRGSVGSHPWGIPKPVVVDLSAAHALGYQPAAHYGEAVAAACQWAEAAAGAGMSHPSYIDRMFDYAAEDALLDQG